VIYRSVAVLRLFEGAYLWHIDVVGLVLRKLGELSAKGGKVKCSNLLIKLLWQYVHLAVFVLVSGAVFPEVDLGEDLVCERARHNK